MSRRTQSPKGGRTDRCFMGCSGPIVLGGQRIGKGYACLFSLCRDCASKIRNQKTHDAFLDAIEKRFQFFEEVDRIGEAAHVPGDAIAPFTDPADPAPHGAVH